VTDGQTDDNRP